MENECKLLLMMKKNHGDERSDSWRSAMRITPRCVRTAHGHCTHEVLAAVAKSTKPEEIKTVKIKA